MVVGLRAILLVPNPQWAWDPQAKGRLDIILPLGRLQATLNSNTK